MTGQANDDSNVYIVTEQYKNMYYYIMVVPVTESREPSLGLFAADMEAASRGGFCRVGELENLRTTTLGVVSLPRTLRRRHFGSGSEA